MLSTPSMITTTEHLEHTGQATRSMYIGTNVRLSIIVFNSCYSLNHWNHLIPIRYLLHTSFHYSFHREPTLRPSALTSQSATALKSEVINIASSPSSPAPSSTEIPGFTTPDSGTAPGSFLPSLTARHLLANFTHTGNHRPRSQTRPLVGTFRTSSPDTSPSTYVMSMLESSLKEHHDSMTSKEGAMKLYRLDDMLLTTSVSEMRPPQIPSYTESVDTRH